MFKRLAALVVVPVFLFLLGGAAVAAEPGKPVQTKIEDSSSTAKAKPLPVAVELEGTDKVFILHDLTTPQLTKQVRDGILARLEEKEEQT